MRNAKLKSRIPQIVTDLKVLVDEAVVEGAHWVRDSAEERLRVHRRTQELENQLHVDDRKREGVYVVAGDPKDPSFAFYGHMLEHGTTNAPPYPFLVPSLEEHREGIVALARWKLRGLERGFDVSSRLTGLDIDE